MLGFRGVFLATLGIVFALTASVAAAQPIEKRIGLVVGNAAYPSGALATTANDAGLVAQTLQAAGFDVIGARDLDDESFRHSVRDFLDKVTAAGPDAVAFVYFAGHGVQLEGENYLVPIDAKIERDADVPLGGLRVFDFIVRPLASLHLKASFVVLDAARANSFAKSGQPIAGGLALTEAPPSMLIAFNAAPGTIAPDGQGPYGPYAQALIEMIREGGLAPSDLFDRVRLRVNEVTKGAQVPWSVSKIVAPFVFLERSADAPPPPIGVDQVKAIRSRPLRELGAQEAYIAAVDRDTIGGYQEFVDAYPNDPLTDRARAILAARREALTWRRTCVADTPEAYWTYLQRYPRGPHAYDARRRLTRLAASLEPPPAFSPIVYDVPPPPPAEIVYVERPVLVFSDPVFAFAPPPPPPVFLLPPPLPVLVALPPPPPPVGLFVLPAPVFVPVAAWVQPPVYVAPPPPNNVIFANIHNTVVINQATNTVNVTGPSGQPVVPVAQTSAAAQPPGAAPGPVAPQTASPSAVAPATQSVSATPVGPSLPPSVARKAALTQSAPGGGPASPATPAQARPGQITPLQNTHGQPPTSQGQPASPGQPGIQPQPAQSSSGSAAPTSTPGKPAPAAASAPAKSLPSSASIPGTAGPASASHALPQPGQTPGAAAPASASHALPQPGQTPGAAAPASASHALPQPGQTRGAAAPASASHALPQPGQTPGAAAPAASASHALPQPGQTPGAAAPAASASHALPQPGQTPGASGPASASHGQPSSGLSAPHGAPQLAPGSRPSVQAVEPPKGRESEKQPAKPARPERAPHPGSEHAPEEKPHSSLTPSPAVPNPVTQAGRQSSSEPSSRSSSSAAVPATSYAARQTAPKTPRITKVVRAANRKPSHP